MAQPALPPSGFDELSSEEKLAYIQALWDHLAEHPAEIPVREWQVKSLPSASRHTGAVR
jgi:hypothetical protein